jgi:hypothetical protein
MTQRRVAASVRLFRSMGNELGKGSFFKSMGLADIDDDTRVSVCGHGTTTIIWRGVVAPALTREDKVHLMRMKKIEKNSVHAYMLMQHLRYICMCVSMRPERGHACTFRQVCVCVCVGTAGPVRGACAL